MTVTLHSTGQYRGEAIIASSTKKIITVRITEGGPYLVTYVSESGHPFEFIFSEAIELDGVWR